MLREYENIYILKPQVDNAIARKFVIKMKNLIENNNLILIEAAIVERLRRSD